MQTIGRNKTCGVRRGLVFRVLAKWHIIIRIGFIGFRGIAYYRYNDMIANRAIIIRIGFIGFWGYSKLKL